MELADAQLRDLAVLSAMLAGGFGGEEGVRAKRSFMKTLLRIARGDPPAPKAFGADQKQNRRSLVARLFRMGAGKR